MKQLELTPPLLIITMGYPGAGKTFFARQFAEQYKLPRISEDRIRFELFERPQFSKEEADIISRIQLYTIEEAMQTEQTIICEGTFLTLKERKQIYDMAQRNKYRTLTVWLQTDASTSAQRASQRDKRNPDSKYSNPLNSLVFNRLKETLERPTEKEVAVVVSGKHAYKSQALTVLRKITSIYSESLLKQQASNQSQPERASPRPARRIIQRMVQ